MVVKASAGVAFRAPILEVATAGEAADLLSAAGFHLVGLAADGPSTLFEAEWPDHVCFVLGSETAGVGEEVADRVAVLGVDPDVRRRRVAQRCQRQRRSSASSWSAAPPPDDPLGLTPSRATRLALRRCVESLDSASSRTGAGVGRAS